MTTSPTLSETTTLPTLADFAAKYGIAAICRRHFGYEKPVSDDEMGGYAVRGALTYLRALESSRLGLTFKEARKAYEQGRALLALGIAPTMVVTGCDQRNRDGGRFSAEGILDAKGPAVPSYTSPAVTYPHYTDFELVRQALQAHGDYAVHRYLAGNITRIWSEPASVFDARILAATTADYGVTGLVLFDLNFEQITLLYFRLVRKLALADIPYEPGAWCPTMGGGIVISANRQVAAEFRPDFSIAQ